MCPLTNCRGRRTSSLGTCCSCTFVTAAPWARYSCPHAQHRRAHSAASFRQSFWARLQVVLGASGACKTKYAGKDWTCFSPQPKRVLRACWEPGELTAWEGCGLSQSDHARAPTWHVLIAGLLSRGYHTVPCQASGYCALSRQPGKERSPVRRCACFHGCARRIASSETDDSW